MHYWKSCDKPTFLFNKQFLTHSHQDISTAEIPVVKILFLRVHNCKLYRADSAMIESRFHSRVPFSYQQFFLDIVLLVCDPLLWQKRKNTRFFPLTVFRNAYIKHKIMQTMFSNLVISIISNLNRENLVHKKNAYFFSSDSVYSFLFVTNNEPQIRVNTTLILQPPL